MLTNESITARCYKITSDSNVLNLSHLFQREDMLSRYVQIVAFNLASPGPGKEVPKQGGL